VADLLVGIDLGTTNSCVAVYQHDRPQILLNAEGQRTTPSVVTIEQDGSVLVGGPARRQAIMNPMHTVTAVKRLVGRRFDSPEVAALRSITPYRIVRAPNGDAWIDAGTGPISPPEVQSHILEKLCLHAAAHLETQVQRAVITVPAYFDESQRQATRDAAAIAGLEAMRILNEPTAAALAYGHERSQGKRLVVVDLGGGTFDVTVMMVEDGVFEVLATTGDMLLGGEDFDRAVAKKLAEEILAAHGVDVLADPVAAQRLINEAEDAKKQLTEMDKVLIGLPFLAVGKNGQPINYQRNLFRAEFEAVTGDLIARLVAPCHEALAEARLDKRQVDDILLVGGMTRCAAVQRRIAEVFGHKLSLRINPDEAVALGAALECGILQGSLKGVVLIDVAPHTIGLRAAGNRMVPLVHRSESLPTRVTKVFATTADNQDYVEVEVLQGDDALASNNRRLSRLRLEGLPRAAKGEVKVVVTFSLDASGLLRVSAKEKATGKEAQVSVVADTGLGRAQVERLVAERRQAEE
jgi:molecular chaperone DnaK